MERELGALYITERKPLETPTHELTRRIPGYTLTQIRFTGQFVGGKAKRFQGIQLAQLNDNELKSEPDRSVGYGNGSICPISVQNVSRRA